MNKSIASPLKMWLKVCNLEHSLFPQLRQAMGALTPKEEMARASVARQGYNFQTTLTLLSLATLFSACERADYQHPLHRSK